MKKIEWSFDVKDSYNGQDLARRIAELEGQVEALRLEKYEITQALCESRHRSQALLETIPDLMFVLSREGKVLDFQANDATDLAMEQDRLIRIPVERRHAAAGCGFRSARYRYGAGAKPSPVCRIPASGEKRPLGFRGRIAPLTNDSVLAIVRNITPQKQAERALRRSERKFRKLYERAPIGIFRTDTRGRALSVNSTMARMLGLDDPEEAVSFYSDLGAQLDVDPEVRERFVRRLRQEGRVENFDTRRAPLTGGISG